MVPPKIPDDLDAYPCTCGEVFLKSAALKGHLASCAGQLDADRVGEQLIKTDGGYQRPMATESESADGSTESMQTGDDYAVAPDSLEVAHIGASQFRVADKQGNHAKVDLETGEVEPRYEGPDGGNQGVSEFTHRAMLAAIRAKGHEPDMDMEAVQLWASMLGDVYDLKEAALTASNGAQATSGGGESASGGSDAPDDADGGDDTFTPISGFDDHDADTLETALDEWLENYAQVKGDLKPEWVEFETVETHVPAGWDTPHAGVDTQGFTVEMGAPWDHGQYDNDANSVSDAWKDAGDALREIMKSEDEVIYFGEPDYTNFIPAVDVEDLTS